MYGARWNQHQSRRGQKSFLPEASNFNVKNKPSNWKEIVIISTWVEHNSLQKQEETMWALEERRLHAFEMKWWELDGWWSEKLKWSGKTTEKKAKFIEKHHKFITETDLRDSWLVYVVMEGALYLYGLEERKRQIKITEYIRQVILDIMQTCTRVRRRRV